MQKKGYCAFDYNCCYSWCCPNCAMASARQKYDDSDWCFNCLSLTPASLRNIIREGYQIEGGCMEDILCGLFCFPCAINEQINEVELRGATRGGATKSNVPQIPWLSGMFGCCSNTGNCLYGCCCPNCAFAQARTNFDGSSCIFNTFCLTPCLLRNVVREGYNLEGSCFEDILATVLCCMLTAVQALNETDARGRASNPMSKAGGNISVAAPPELKEMEADSYVSRQPPNRPPAYTK